MIVTTDTIKDGAGKNALIVNQVIIQAPAGRECKLP